jgi:cobalt-zinc-cadmium efflux system membrane fusion protein
VSPIQGTIIQRHTVLGEAVEPIANLFTVADTSKLWLWIDVYERDVFQVREGELVTFSASATTKDPMMSTTGKITWVGADVNEKTRTTKVRAEIPNPDGKLRSGQYGKARIRIDDAHSALVVSKAAVQQFDGVDLVFLTQENATYRPQRIKTKPLNRPDVVEVAWGLKPGQEVVTDGSFLLKTELMKGSIGAGCCE